MAGFATLQHQQLYGSERRLPGEMMKSKLTQSHVLRNGEFNIEKSSRKPGFDWSSVTHDDYNMGLPAVEVGKQYSEDYKKETGSCIPIKQEGVPLDSYRMTSNMEAYTDKGTKSKRGYIGNNPTTNWPDMTPKLIEGMRLGNSEYKGVYKQQDASLERPSFPKMDTSKIKLPLPLDPVKHNINVSLGAHDSLTSTKSEAHSNYLKTQPKPFDNTSIKLMKDEMEWNSRIFREGDYNGARQGLQTVTDLDFGKVVRGATDVRYDPNRSDGQPADLDTMIDKELHYMPSLIENSMKGNTSMRDGKDGKKYHTKAHFALGTQQDNTMSTYYKDFLPHEVEYEPPRAAARPSGSKLVEENQVDYATTNRSDFYGSSIALTMNSSNRDVRRANMQKQNTKSIEFSGIESPGTTNTVFQHDFKSPPKGIRPLSPAKEKKCEFDFLESDGALETYTRRLANKTETRDNYVGGQKLVLNGEKNRVRSAAKRRLKSGRRGHFILGNSAPSYRTEAVERFTGKPRNDDHIPAAGKTETLDREYRHMHDSLNTEDIIADPASVSIQESRNAIDSYAGRQKPEVESVKLTIMKTDYPQMEARIVTDAQLRQMNAEKTKSSKPAAISHYFHIDTSTRNNYETTTMASYIKPELMSGKVHLSSLQ